MPSYTQPKIQKQSDLFSLIGITIINCNATLENQKKWLIFKVDESTGLDLMEITNTQIKINPTINYAQLVIQPQTLSNGLHRFVYRATMTTSFNKSIEISSQIDTFIKIIPSGLVLSTLALSQPMYGGTIEIMRGWNQTIKFNPFLNTFDIDSVCVITSLSFKYACQIIDSNLEQGYPQRPGTNQTIYLDEFFSNQSLSTLLKCFNSISNLYLKISFFTILNL